MKIAIMTLPLGQNYGGMMQAYALQNVLRNKGHSVCTIDYNVANPSPLYRTLRFGYRLAKKIIGRRVAPIDIEANYKVFFNKNREFVKSHLVLSEYVDSVYGLKQHFKRENYDAVIVGSDQTWRPAYSPNIYSHYLDFIEDEDIRRIAYASSFGVDHWEYSSKETERCARLAKKFSFISVRESSAIELCRTKLDVEASLVLDPTLLLDHADYKQVIGGSRLNEEGRGVYTYFLDKTPEKKHLADKVSNELGQDVFSCQAKASISALTSRELSDYVAPDIRDWLSGFANASFVLTDSFHGMVFSIVFNKPFIVVNNKERGGARFYSLLNELGMSIRLVDNDDVLMIKEIDCFYDPPNCKEKLLNLSNSSKEALFGALI